MKKATSLVDRAEKAWYTNPMWNLAQQLHEEGYDETSIMEELSDHVTDVILITLRNYLRDIKLNIPKPRRL